MNFSRDFKNSYEFFPHELLETMARNTSQSPEAAEFLATHLPLPSSTMAPSGWGEGEKAPPAPGEEKKYQMNHYSSLD